MTTERVVRVINEMPMAVADFAQTLLEADREYPGCRVRRTDEGAYEVVVDEPDVPEPDVEWVLLMPGAELWCNVSRWWPRWPLSRNRKHWRMHGSGLLLTWAQLAERAAAVSADIHAPGQILERVEEPERVEVSGVSGPVPIHGGSKRTGGSGGTVGRSRAAVVDVGTCYVPGNSDTMVGTITTPNDAEYDVWVWHDGNGSPPRVNVTRR